jgi:regulatory protein SWI5
MIPTLGPIAQDDISVSLTDTTGHQQYPQHPLQVAQQHSMAQPGRISSPFENERMQHLHNPHQHHHHPSLSMDTSHLHHSPEHPSTPTIEMHPPPQQHLFPSPQTPHRQNFTPSPQLAQGSFSPAPAPAHYEEAVQKLKDSVEALYGPGSNVFINILPTPVATPQKRALTAPPQQMDSAPIPLDFGNDGLNLGMEHSNSSQGFEAHHSPEGSFYSPGFGGSPAHSPYCSPVQQTMHSFMDPTPHLNFDDPPVLSSAHFNSSQTTLADVEPMYSPAPGSVSPDRSPRQMSIADLSLETIIEDTGVSTEQVSSLIEHDPVTNSFACLFEGCGRKGFQRRENVRSHVQTHLGDRQYRCVHCSKTFVRPHDLKRHSKIHSGFKPYACPCGQQFVRMDALTRHRQRGSCSGAFEDAIPRTPAKRGRPRKKRPEMDDRVDKANRTRQMNATRKQPQHDYSSSGASSYGGSGSEAENTPSPEASGPGADFDFATIDADKFESLDTAKFTNLDTAKLVDFTEEESKPTADTLNDNTEPFR